MKILKWIKKLFNHPECTIMQKNNRPSKVPMTYTCCDWNDEARSFCEMKGSPC